MKEIFLGLMLTLIFATVGLAQDPGWPRQKTSPAGKLVYYQPQVDEWKDYKDLDFRMAFSMTPTGGKQAVGVVNIQAKTDVNVNARTVLLNNPVITGTHFPSLDANKTRQMDQLVRTFLPPDSSVVISLDRLVASVNKSESAPAVEVRNDPPTIFVSNRPAMLVQVDGDPVTAEIKGTNLRFIVNTNWPIFFDKSSSTYYLFAGKRWLSGASLNGPWLTTVTLPKDMVKVGKDPQWSGLANAISPPTVDRSAAPTVFYSSGPAEVILFQGQPVYSRIANTQLVYATNTDADLFVYAPTQQYFYLAAGRWFSSTSLQGPWNYATPNLPVDFAQIPLGSPAAHVLASVPGTEEAKDAVLLAQVPTTVEVNPTTAAAKVKVTYNGPPEFKPIEGTSLFYATNTTDKVIRADGIYYLCLQGIWFASTTAEGPWNTATSVPKAIYTIPPSSPVYNITYVTQTTTPTGNVMASYTAGYMGAFIVGVRVGAIIITGTGYYYPPYIYRPLYGYPIYFPYAVTYGYGAYYYYRAGAYALARGVYGPYAGAIGWGAYNSYTGAYARGGSMYGPYGAASVARAFNPYTGTYARGAFVSTAYGTRSAARAYNPSTGVGAATRQGSSPYGQWGSSVVSNGNRTVQTGHVSTSQGTVAGARSSTGAAVIGGRGANGSAAVARSASGDLYAAKDGNVYKKTGGTWKSYNNGSWNPANSRAQNQDFQNRQRGAIQSQRMQSVQRFGGGGGFRSGGARRGGGGRRR